MRLERAMTSGLDGFGLEGRVQQRADEMAAVVGITFMAMPSTTSRALCCE